ncbi:MAG: LysM peptidoglycan-binding domain-containing protein [Opitutaceae bacterium]
MMLLFRSLSIAALLFGLLSGCAPSGVEIVSETDEKQYQLAQDYKTQGRMEEALSAFHRVIDARRDSPESHLEAGYIYLRGLKDPVRAIYHFDRYLQFKPNSPQATQVRQLIETAEKEFARQLPAQPYQGNLDRVDMMELVKNLKQENDSLKRDLIAAEARILQLEGGAAQTSRPSVSQTQTATTRQQPTTPPTAPNPASVPRTHTVQSGDTLSAISTRYYGTPSRWIDIYQANRDRLRSESALKVGQELRIP